MATMLEEMIRLRFEEEVVGRCVFATFERRVQVLVAAFRPYFIMHTLLREPRERRIEIADRCATNRLRPDCDFEHRRGEGNF